MSLSNENSANTSTYDSGERPLVYIDGGGNEVSWKPGDPKTAHETFGQFFKQRLLKKKNVRFVIEDQANNEELILMLDRRMVCRVKHGKETISEYVVTRDVNDYVDRARVFINEQGFSSLDNFGPWLPDEATHMQELIRTVFTELPLGTIHPHELIRRLTILACINGTPPTVDDHGVTHYGYSAPDGSTVDAWVKSEAEGILTVFQPSSPLNRAEDPALQRRLYDAIPEDLLELARGGEHRNELTMVQFEDGTSLPAATGVYLIQAPIVMPQGVAVRLQQEGLDLSETGISVLLEAFLKLPDFTPRAMKKLEPWWSDTAIRDGFKQAEALQAEQQKAAPPKRRSDIDGFMYYWDSFCQYDANKNYYIFSPLSSDAYLGNLLEILDSLYLSYSISVSLGTVCTVKVVTDPEIDAEIESWKSKDLKDGARLSHSLARAGLAKAWYHWCDPTYN